VSRTLRVFYRVKPDILAQCKVNPSFCEDVLAGDEDGLVESFDVDQSWDAIHFVISPNRAYPDQGTLDEFLVFDWAITGREPVHKGLALGHGPASLLDADTVRDVSNNLTGLDQRELRETFDPEAMDTAEVHPEIWTTTVRTSQEQSEAWDYIWDHFTRLREFYKRASDGGDAVITWIIPFDEAQP